jgi:iron(III) transport system substrate-binding protein
MEAFMKNRKIRTAAAVLAFSMLVLPLMNVYANGASDPASSKPMEAAPKKKPVVVYSNHFDTPEAFLSFFNKSPIADKYEVTLISLGGTAMTNRVIAEVNNPQADVIYGGSMLNHAQMKKVGALAKWKPDWAADVEDVYKDAEGFYYGTKTEALNIIASLDRLQKMGYSKMPKDWEDLVANYSGHYFALLLTGGTGSTMHFSILERYKDPNGHLGVSKEGWALMKAFRDGARQQGTNYKSWFDGTDTPLGMMWPNGVKEAEDTYKIKMEQMNPSYGMPFVTSSIAVTKSGDAGRMAAAQEVAQWIGSADHQYEFNMKSAAVPVNKKASVKLPADHQGIIINSKVKTQNIDWDYILKYADEWLVEIELNYPCGRKD